MAKIHCINDIAKKIEIIIISIVYFDTYYIIKYNMYQTLLKLFPKDIIQIILLYDENQLIFVIQNYCPSSLNRINVYDDELNEINENNYKYVTKYDCHKNKTISDILVSNFTNLTELNCSHCNIIDNSLQHLINLTDLDCSGCYNITDASIKQLVTLTELYCSNCYGITDASIEHLIHLIKLQCSDCNGITYPSINLVRL